MNLFVYSELNSPQKERLRSKLPAAVEPIFSNEVPEEAQQAAFQKADLIFGNPPLAWFEVPPPALNFWQLDSAGFDQYRTLIIDTTVSNMGDYYSEACAETMVAGVLAFFRGIPTLVHLQAQKNWQGKHLRSSLGLLGHKKVVILGAGTIATAIKKMLSGFGCEVKLTARQNPLADFHSYDALLQYLPQAEVVINTLPGNVDKYVSAEFLEQMKAESLYANVGRGNTTDEAALIQALQTGKLAGAILDVTEQEPLPATSPLWEMENVLLTQHTGGGQKNEVEGKVDRFISNLSSYLNGEEVPDQVNLYKGY